MQWGNQQQHALDQIGKWVKDPKSKQVFKLFGWAGTGKTTLAKHVADSFGGSVMYAAYTGKAALVLRSKGCEGASTIHSTIYRFWQDERSGKFGYSFNLDSDLTMTDLLIVDEVSWVDSKIGRDLESFGVKILVLGDPDQLPPIKGEGYFTTGQPDVMLTDIHRQAGESPIIRLSVEAREGRRLVPGMYGNCEVILRQNVDKDRMGEIALAADQILCGMNATRKGFNARIRQLKGRQGDIYPWLPVEGDRLVCLKNNHDRNLLNGGLWDVTGLYDMSENVNLAVTSLDNVETVEEMITVPPEFFQGTDSELDWRILKNFDQFTYGYCLTVHKAQGSEWPHVLLSDESSVFKENARKHLYTGITRASEQLTLIV